MSIVTDLEKQYIFKQNELIEQAGYYDPDESGLNNSLKRKEN